MDCVFRVQHCVLWRLSLCSRHSVEFHRYLFHGDTVTAVLAPVAWHEEQAPGSHDREDRCTCHYRPQYNVEACMKYPASERSRDARRCPSNVLFPLYVIR